MQKLIALDNSTVSNCHQLAMQAARDLWMVAVMLPGRISGDLMIQDSGGYDRLAATLAHHLQELEDHFGGWRDIPPKVKLAFAAAAHENDGPVGFDGHASSTHDAVQQRLCDAVGCWQSFKLAGEKYGRDPVEIVRDRVKDHDEDRDSYMGRSLPEFDIRAVEAALEIEAAIVLKVSHGETIGEREQRANSANTPKVFSGGVPENADVLDLMARLDGARGTTRTKNEIAREFTGEVIGNESRAQSLLSQIRRRERKATLSQQSEQ